MKVIISFFTLCLLITQFIACKKDIAKSSNSLQATANNIAGTFTVTSFVSTIDQASVFSGFTFTFGQDGTIVAAKSNDTFNGTWTFDDGNSTEIKINFSDAPLTELNKSWHISDLTDNHLLLTDEGKNEDANDDHSSDNSSIEFERD